jgi:hypothetical protein
MDVVEIAWDRVLTVARVDVAWDVGVRVGMAVKLLVGMHVNLGVGR